MPRFVCSFRVFWETTKLTLTLGSVDVHHLVALACTAALMAAAAEAGAGVAALLTQLARSSLASPSAAAAALTAGSNSRLL